jgi:hypothetical protein
VTSPSAKERKRRKPLTPPAASMADHPWRRSYREMKPRPALRRARRATRFAWPHPPLRPKRSPSRLARLRSSRDDGKRNWITRGSRDTSNATANGDIFNLMALGTMTPAKLTPVTRVLYSFAFPSKMNVPVHSPGGTTPVPTGGG